MLYTRFDNNSQAILAYVEPVKGITTILASQTATPSTSFFIQVFILFAILSSFVGISLGLYDFIADGFHASKRAAGKIKLLSLTFLPPLIITLTQNSLFLKALGFAGLISTILFGLYPVMLTWSGRYLLKLKTHYRLSINKVIILLVIIFCLTIIYTELLALNQS